MIEAPYDLEAERAVLGAALLEPELASTVAEIPAGAFHAEKHRDVARAIARLVKSGEPADLMNVRAAMEAMKTFDPASTAGTLAALMEEATVSTQLGSYMARLRELAARRSLIRVARDAAVRAADPSKPFQEVLGELVGECVDLEHGATPDAIVDGATLASELLSSSEELGLKTGIPALDNLAGGLHPSNITVVAGRPGLGKTTIATQIYHELTVVQGLPVFFASLEMTRRQLGKRLLAYTANLPLSSDKSHPGLVHGAEQLAASSALIADPGSPTLEILLGLIRRAVVKHKAVAAIVDHIGEISVPPRESRYLEVAEITAGLKATARQLGIPILALSQLNRRVEKVAKTPQRPNLGDLREGGSIEERAATVMFVWTPLDVEQDKDPKLPVRLYVAKARFGRVGEEKYLFNRIRGRFDPDPVGAA